MLPPHRTGNFFSYNVNFADNVKLSERYLRCNGASCIMYGNILRLANLQLLRAVEGEKYEDLNFKNTLTSQFSLALILSSTSSYQPHNSVEWKFVHSK
jgi:hypothetical protein